MQITLPKPYMRRLWRTIVEFGMIKPSDRVLVGLSGGKDSSFLTYALACARDSSPFNFDLGAVTLDLGFTKELVDMEPLRLFCSDLEIPFYHDRVEAGDFILNEQGKSPCAKCAHLRRGTLSTLAREQGYNKIAYAHHLDDAVETFLMSMIYSGQVTTFQPVTHLDRSGVTVIRPLCYFRETELVYAGKFVPFTPIKSSCPLDKHTTRQKVKELIGGLCADNHYVFDNLTAAMRGGAPLELWPRKLTRKELKPMYRELMNSTDKEEELH
ncbi:MAG: PP-loop domain-containing protein [Bacillota bacterium]|nr:MAG: PP-loop domain-containing protein [Bacillota bacterium]MBS3949541.1 tRNA 2-thiocytidine biosynthesis protein TtcA [Peptococcaceae bacterium]